MDLTAIKERIRREQKNGDMREACRRIGVGEQMFRVVMRTVNTFEELTVSQEKLLSAMIDILDERKSNQQKFARAC